MSEVRIFSTDAVPRGWMSCDGRELPIEKYQPLFSLLGWRWGGDRQFTFAVPVLRHENQITFAIAIDGVYATTEEGFLMDTQYIGEIRLFSGRVIPTGWTVCDGKELPVAEPYAALYALIGRRFGGGNDTFALPDLRQRLPEGVNVIMALDGIDPGNSQEDL